MFGDASATAYIAKRYGPPELAAFARCRHPAMRSDYLRICFVLAEGGLYVDADNVLMGDGWKDIFSDGTLKVQPLCYDVTAGGMVSMSELQQTDLPAEGRIFYVNNNPIAAPAGHPVLRRALARATNRLLDGEPTPEIQATTGPGNLTAVLAAHAAEQLDSPLRTPRCSSIGRRPQNRAGTSLIARTHATGARWTVAETSGLNRASMNLNKVVGPMRTFGFRTWRFLTVSVPGTTNSGLWRRTRPDRSDIGRESGAAAETLAAGRRELNRFRTSEGVRLTSITRRLVAVDARDGRAVAATVDVDAVYRIGHQLYVQPDDRLAECFAEDEPVPMTRQEVAVAKSHVEAWKTIASGT